MDDHKADLGKISQGQLKKLARVISDAKNLTGQQEEILERILAGETDIGELRIAYLDEYFDLYSKNLDLIARKHSRLNDAFLVLDKKLADNQKKLHRQYAATDRTKPAKSDTDAPKQAKKQQPQPQAKKSTNTERDETPASKKQQEVRQPDNSSKKLGTKKQSTKKPTANDLPEKERIEALITTGNATKKPPKKANKVADSGNADQGSIVQQLRQQAAQQNQANLANNKAAQTSQQALSRTGHMVEAKLTNIQEAIDTNTTTFNNIQVVDTETTAEANQGQVNAVQLPVEPILDTQELPVELEGIQSLIASYIQAENERAEVLQKTIEALSALNITPPQKAADNTTYEVILPDIAVPVVSPEVTIPEIDVPTVTPIVNTEGLITDTNQLVDYIIAAIKKHNNELQDNEEALAAVIRRNIEALAALNIPKLQQQKADNTTYDVTLPEINVPAITPIIDTKGLLADTEAVNHFIESFDPEIKVSLPEVQVPVVTPVINTEDLLANTGTVNKFIDSFVTADERRNASIQDSLTALTLANKADTADKEVINLEITIQNIQPAPITPKTDLTIEAEPAQDQNLIEVFRQTEAQRAEIVYKNAVILNAIEAEYHANRLARLIEFEQAAMDGVLATRGTRTKKSNKVELTNSQPFITQLIRAMKNSNIGGGGNNGGSGSTEDDGAAESVYNTITDEQRSDMSRPAFNPTKYFEWIRASYDEQVNKITDLQKAKNGKTDPKSVTTVEAELKKRTEATQKKIAKLQDDIIKFEEARATLIFKQVEDIHNRVEELFTSASHELSTLRFQSVDGLNALIAQQMRILDKGHDIKTYAGTKSQDATLDESIELEKHKIAYIKKAREAMEADIAKKMQEAARRNNGIITTEERTKIRRTAAEKHKLDLKNLDALTKADLAKRRKIEADKALREDVSDSFEKIKSGNLLVIKDLFTDSNGEFDRQKTDVAAQEAIGASLKAISTLAQQLESTIKEIASYQSAIDTRLQGSSNAKKDGSYWAHLSDVMTSVGAINPFFKQSDFANSIKDLVNRGISFDIHQRAFLMTIQEKIANTFDVADGTLLRLIRIQQEDSTAGRLGMESALNHFLNNMYETSEYLTQVADSVRGSLEEMQALMRGAEAAEVEYQVQKWLGSLYSVGMSDSAVNSISTALGQIGAGQIEGLTNGGAGNLLVMAANEANLSIADILTNGITAKDTNKLLQAAVNYLAELAESSKDNKVVQQQLADVFGVKASDLRAAENLVLPGSVNAVYGSELTYSNMLKRLNDMAASMGARTSMAEKMTNIWENGQYTLASGMANNPVAYFIYQMASVLDSTVGGIPIPGISIMGNMVDLHTSVADLMRVGAMSVGILNSIGPVISGIGNSFSGQKMLNQLGISAGSGLSITPRGDGAGVLAGGGNTTTSSSGYVGNSSGSDIKDATMQESKDSKKQQMVEAKEEDEGNEVTMINETVVKIYELLEDVTTGKSTFKVKVENYGLTKANTLGVGVVNSSGVTGNIDIGTWTMNT